MRLAIFDLDGTLLRANSWQVFFWRTVRVHPGRAPALLARLAWRGLGLTNSHRLQRATLATMLGLDAAAIRRIGDQVFETKLRDAIEPAARAELAARVRDGFEPVMATAAFEFLAAPVAKELGLQNVVATRLEFADGKFTGRTIPPEPRGRDKVEAVRSHFVGRPVDWGQSCAFSDELQDLPLFELVGEAVFVRRRKAKVSGLHPRVRVVDWGER